MAEISKEPKVSLRLIVDEEKNKVVLAEAGKDFVDVLFSLLMLPIGTVVRLLRNHRNSEPVTVGCFSNLYKSVEDMGIDNFEPAACKQMLLYPTSIRDALWKRFKLNLNPNEGVKFYRCPNFFDCIMCSNFSCSECKCGSLMDKEIPLVDTVADKIQNDVGVFIKGRFSFIITDDLKVSVDSTGLILKTLGCLGYADVSKLGERLLDIGQKEISKLLSPSVKEIELLTLDVIVRKQDMKVLYVECCEDFVDLLFTFLAVPLESIWEITSNNITLGCIGNLHRSFKDLSFNGKPKDSSFKCVLPHYYRCRKQFPMITTEQPRSYYRCKSYNSTRSDYSLTTFPERGLKRLVSVTLVDPKSRCGFVKRDTKFTVSDDLIITPKNSSRTSIHLLKKLKIQADDLDVQVISIGKTEAMSLLGASLVTSSALNTALWNLIAKKP